MQGIVFDIQHFCLHDGPGIRTVVFLKGCPLKCQWCHNPESQNAYPQIMYSKEKCIGCGECVKACPQKKFSLHNPWSCDNLASDECSACIKACPSGALRLCGDIMNTETLFKEITRDIVFYNHSGGGITLSGGEPLMQPDFSYELLRCAKNKQINTAIETCGFFDESLVPKFHTVTDLWLYDIKHFLDDVHLKYTGVKNDKIFKNLHTLDLLGANIVLRAPIIPGVNDNENHISMLGKLAGELRSVKRIELIPYHTLGVSKAKQLGKKDVFNPDVGLLRDKINLFFNLLQKTVACEVKIQQ
ncbi:MAG: glycyl-radical enzyme activating protein [Clostridia bacterium]|nr:glycyl-radical enzyme activating protein [Clostridia bacterium]